MTARTAILTVVALGLVLAAVLEGSRFRWVARTRELRERLRAAAPAPAPTVVTAAELEALPSPVARYLRAALREGQPVVTRARIRWEGRFNMGSPARDNWKPFTADQEFVPRAPGFVWDARVAMAPGLTVFVRDGFVAGEASMLGAVRGLLTVVDRRGTPGLASGALQRYLAEAVWFPTALLPTQGVTWTALDDSTARATIASGATTVSLDFRFGPDGLVREVRAPERTYDDGKGPPRRLPWIARILGWAAQDGMQVPDSAVVEWRFPERPYAYWRGRPVTVSYEYARPAAP
jgi:hypothetical protein